MRDFFQYVFQRLNVKAMAMLVALVFAVAGIFMIYAGFRDEGSIDIRTAFVQGNLKSGSVGIIVIFMSLTVCLGCLIARKDNNKIEVKRGNLNVKWSGNNPDIARVFLDILSRKSQDDDDGNPVA